MRVAPLLALVLAVAALAVAAEAGFAQGRPGSNGAEGRAVPASAEPYRPGPIDRSGSGLIDPVELPRGVGELLGLSCLVAIVIGLRASGLSGAAGR